jgi:two-component system cell cycle sensor histidine kinase PleC
MESGMFGTLGSEKYQEYCHDILTSGHYLLEVINDILDMSKIEAGRMKLDMEPLDLSKTLAESLRVVSGAPTTRIWCSTPRSKDHLRWWRSPRHQADHRQPVVQRGQIHARRRQGHRPQPHVLDDSIVLMIADTGIGIARTRCAAGPAVRAGREPAHQDLSRLGAGPRDRQIADRAAWRAHARAADIAR